MFWPVTPRLKLFDITTEAGQTGVLGTGTVVHVPVLDARVAAEIDKLSALCTTMYFVVEAYVLQYRYCITQSRYLSQPSDGTPYRVEKDTSQDRSLQLRISAFRLSSDSFQREQKNHLNTEECRRTCSKQHRRLLRPFAGLHHHGSIFSFGLWSIAAASLHPRSL